MFIIWRKVYSDGSYSTESPNQILLKISDEFWESSISSTFKNVKNFLIIVGYYWYSGVPNIVVSMFAWKPRQAHFVHTQSTKKYPNDIAER